MVIHNLIRPIGRKVSKKMANKQWLLEVDEKTASDVRAFKLEYIIKYKKDIRFDKDFFSLVVQAGIEALKNGGVK